MAITTKVKQALKAKAHKLQPVVIIGGKGLTINVLKEIDRALHDHQLIKIRIQCEDRDERRGLFDEICQSQSAEGIQLIGRIGILYRELDAVNPSKI
jgi:RNA-binding protein